MTGLSPAEKSDLYNISSSSPCISMFPIIISHIYSIIYFIFIYLFFLLSKSPNLSTSFPLSKLGSWSLMFRKMRFINDFINLQQITRTVKNNTKPQAQKTIWHFNLNIQMVCQLKMESCNECFLLILHVWGVHDSTQRLSETGLEEVVNIWINVIENLLSFTNTKRQLQPTIIILLTQRTWPMNSQWELIPQSAMTFPCSVPRKYIHLFHTDTKNSNKCIF